MKKNLLFVVMLCLLTAGSSFAADYYWVNGAGNWSDINHWRIGSSSGAIPSIVPSAMDDVFFDENSGFGVTDAEKTVILDANGFCHSMNWKRAENQPIFTRSNDSYTIEVWGDLELSADVHYEQQIIFRGESDNNFTTNGPIDGVIGIEVNKPDGTLRLTDSLVNISTNRSNNIVLTAGTFDISGRTVRYAQLNSNNTNERSLNMTSAVVDLSYRWDVRGAHMTLLADSSDLYTRVYLFTDAGRYNRVRCNGKDYNNFGIYNTEFATLEFTNQNSSSYAQIDNDNIVDSLIFKGMGRIFDDNKVNYIRYEQTGRIMGENNVIHVVKNMGNFSVEAAPVTVDSLLLAPNKSSNFVGAVTVNQYLEAKGFPCDAFTELSGDTTSFLLTFAAGATADIDNVFLTGFRAEGPIIPLPVTGIDGQGNQGFIVNPPASSAASTFYWVGGAGDWNDKAHWSLSSGGTGGACIPFINDDVVFDGNSGFSADNNIVSTTGNVYCHDMSWMAGVAPAVFNESAKQKCLVYGSAVLDPNVEMNATLEFTGEETSELSVNGSSSGDLTVLVSKSNSAALNLNDDWSNPNGVIDLELGYLNMPGRKVTVYSFKSTPTYPVRHLDITGSDIHVSHTWAYTGLYKYMEADGSLITSDYEFNVNGLNYPNVALTYAGQNNAFNIRSTSFGSLVFSAATATGNANIGSGNTIRKLEFKGAGQLKGGSNSIDSLILASSRNYTFSGTNGVNKYLSAVSVSCSGLSELRGNPAGTIAFGTGAEVQINNVYLMNMTATGVTPSFTGADAGGNTGWDITSAAGGDRYWVGGAGDWNDASHWSLTSGGSAGACVPTIFDNVLFDAASGFTADSKTVTINNGNAYCRNIDWSGATNSPVWEMAAAWTIEAWGTDIILNPEARFDVSPLVAKGSSAATLKGTAQGNFDVKVDKEHGSLTLANDYSNNQTDFILTRGLLDLSGRTLEVASIDNMSLDDTMSLNINGANISATTVWCFAGDSAAHVLNADNSSIVTSAFVASAGRYDKVSANGVNNSDAVLNGASIGNLRFTNTSSVSQIGINGTNNKIGTLKFAGGGGVYGTGNVIDTLIFFPGSLYQFTGGTTTTVVDAWYGSGTPCKLTEIANLGTGNATVNKTNGSAAFDYIRIKGITAVAETAFSAGEHTIDQGSNVGWDIAAYNGATPLSGLGDDRAVAKSAFPYTISTEGFFGTPLAQYTWEDGSQLDSLVITDTGYYNIKVQFEDGCTVEDTVHITYDLSLPVDLKSFDVDVDHCTPLLQWTIAHPVNFNRFEVERSADGQHFETLAKIMPTASLLSYRFEDKTLKDEGTYYYRLKLIDNDTRFRYSPEKTAKVGCLIAQMRVYPNPTDGIVHVIVPGQHQNVQIGVANMAGQRVNAPVSSSAADYSVDLSTAPAGVYLIRVWLNGQQQTFKVIRK